MSSMSTGTVNEAHRPEERGALRLNSLAAGHLSP
jgi:hypothetical protein